MMSSREVKYENAQWRLTATKKMWFFETRFGPKNGTYEMAVSYVMGDDDMLEHIAFKKWCNMDTWFDVCRKAAELSPWKPSYDLEKKFQEIKDEASKH